MSEKKIMKEVDLSNILSPKQSKIMYENLHILLEAYDSDSIIIEKHPEENKIRIVKPLEVILASETLSVFFENK